MDPLDPVDALDPRMGSFLRILCVFYQSKRTLTPLNPPKARHSSGMPWESLWEGQIGRAHV